MEDDQKMSLLLELISKMNEDQIDQLLLITYEWLKNKRP